MTTPPQLVAGSILGGARFVALDMSASSDPLLLLDLESPSATVSDVIVTQEALLVSTCCEPAAGGRWSVTWEGTVDSLGFGEVVDAAGGAVVSVDPNGFLVRVDVPDSDPILLTSGDGQMPIDAAISPDGSTLVVIASSENDVTSIYVVDPATDKEFDLRGPIATNAELGGHPALPAIDRLGRLWLVTRDRANEIVLRHIALSLASGEIQEYEIDSDPIDQEFDDSGIYLIMADARGSIWWRSDGEEGNLPGLPAMDRIDW